MTGLICIKCPSAEFLDPKKEICYKTGGLYCKKLKQIVGKYDQCRQTGSVRVKDKSKKGPEGRAKKARKTR
jgi:hypothetical protein